MYELYRCNVNTAFMDRAFAAQISNIYVCIYSRFNFRSYNIYQNIFLARFSLYSLALMLNFTRLLDKVTVCANE